jgi:hypothetical protein
MAGTLVLDTLQNGAGTASTSADNVIRGCAKAWVNFNGSGGASIRGSYNISSVTRSGTGIYTINFTTAMPNADYAWTIGGWNNGTGNGDWIAAGTGAGSYPTGVSTTSLGMVSYTSAGSNQDQDVICVSIFSS